MWVFISLTASGNVKASAITLLVEWPARAKARGTARYNCYFALQSHVILLSGLVLECGVRCRLRFGGLHCAFVFEPYFVPKGARASVHVQHRNADTRRVVGAGLIDNVFCGFASQTIASRIGIQNQQSHVPMPMFWVMTNAACKSSQCAVRAFQSTQEPVVWPTNGWGIV